MSPGLYTREIEMESDAAEPGTHFARWQLGQPLADKANECGVRSWQEEVPQRVPNLPVHEVCLPENVQCVLGHLVFREEEQALFCD